MNYLSLEETKGRRSQTWKGKLYAILNFNYVERSRFVARWAASLPSGSKVMDIGAGPCSYQPFFSHCQYFAQDLAAYTGTHYGRLNFISDALALPLANASMDAVLCTEVLEHVAEPAAVMREMGRVLRSGGRLLLSAPLGSGLHQEPYHYYGGFSPYWYQRFLPEAGFGAISIQPNGGFFKHYGQESLRFHQFLHPGKLPGKWKILAPLWLLTWPLFRLVLPIACHYLDRLDQSKDFTVGYLVTAEKI